MALNYKNLKAQQRIYYAPPNFQHLMCGTRECTQDKTGTITLTYSDGTRESAPCPDIQLAEAENYFTIVGMVQERARNSAHLA